ncbi:hypothetical protein A3K88_02490 [Pseudomonas putida]|nr:hypothetical protein A3K88_02490 [Pseudomonas putida]
MLICRSTVPIAKLKVGREARPASVPPFIIIGAREGKAWRPSAPDYSKPCWLVSERSGYLGHLFSSDITIGLVATYKFCNGVIDLFNLRSQQGLYRLLNCVRELKVTSVDPSLAQWIAIANLINDMRLRGTIRKLRVMQDA